MGSRRRDLARDFLAKSSVKYDTVYGAAGSGVKIKVNDKEFPYTKPADSNAPATAALQEAGYPKRGANPTLVKMNHPFDIFKPQVAAVRIKACTFSGVNTSYAMSNGRHPRVSTGWLK